MDVSGFVARVRENAHPKGSLEPPEVREGLPLVGPARAFQDDPYAFLCRARARYGDVFTVNLLLYRATFVLGAGAQRRWMLAPTEQLNLNEAVNEAMIPVLGPREEYERLARFEAETHAIIRAGLMKQERIDGYLGSVESVAREFFERWADAGVVDLFRETSRMVNHINIETLVGHDARARFGETIASALYDLETNGIAPEVVAFPRVPTPAQRRCTRARKVLREVLREIVEMRSGSGEPDYISHWLAQRFPDGRGPSLEELRVHLTGVFFAAHTNTTGTFAWTIAHLAEQRALLDRALAEQRDYVATQGSGFDFASLKGLRYLDASMKEAVRLHFAILLLRRAMAPYVEGGFTIPRGHVVCISPILTHLDPSIYPDPERFDPERFLDVATARKLERDGAYLQFGLGGHRCLGEMFATGVLKTALSLLLRDYDLELEGSPSLRSDWTKTLGTAYPVLPVRMRVRRRVGAGARGRAPDQR